MLPFAKRAALFVPVALLALVPLIPLLTIVLLNIIFLKPGTLFLLVALFALVPMALGIRQLPPIHPTAEILPAGA